MRENKNTSPHMWTEEEKEYLADITPSRHHIEILELMNKRFEYQFSIGQEKAAIKRHNLNTGFTGRFPKGHIPYTKGKKGINGSNRTSFKKGHKPHNHMPVGSERVNGDGYVDIKIGEPNKWKGKHIIIWEQYNGPVPKGYVVLFGDKNNRNFNIENLILVNRAELLMMNRSNLIKDNLELTRVGTQIAKLKIKIYEINKNK